MRENFDEKNMVLIEGQKEVVPEKEPTAMELVQHLAQKRMITAREAKLLQFILNIIDTDEEQKKVILQQAIGQMTGSSQG